MSQQDRFLHISDFVDLSARHGADHDLVLTTRKTSCWHTIKELCTSDSIGAIRHAD